MRFESFDADGLNLLEWNIQNNLLSDMKDLVAKYDLADEKSSPYAIENPDDNWWSPYIIRSSADLS
jgi:hypothetical protein